MGIETERLRLRDLKKEDLDDITKNAKDPKIYLYTARIPYQYKKEDAEKFLEKLEKK
jgi:RimJ/RimL family protein N-acetyltransferase